MVNEDEGMLKGKVLSSIFKGVHYELEVEGNETTAAYAAFLPTSGSSSVYVEKIAPGQTYEMTIEMEVKSDLAQKPYVLNVNMQYEDEEYQEYTDKANVSIPIKQEAKIDTGSADIMPESIAVGEQSNVMFSVFNTGKTTLYNVKVSYESDTVESGITYLGNIAPGATGNVDSMVTGIAPDMGEGIVKAVITYEDEAGNEIVPVNSAAYAELFDEQEMCPEISTFRDSTYFDEIYHKFCSIQTISM